MVDDAILTNLSDVQHKAVVHPEGPLLIFAGAGSGKTRVLTHRVAYLIDHHQVNPSRIFAVTFTNKAAAEMKERVEELIPGLGRLVWVSTFHSACVRILRRDAERLGYKSTFAIYDDGDQLSLVKQVLKQLDIDKEDLEPRMVRSLIDRAKCDAMDPAMMKSRLPNILADKYVKVCERYESEMKKNNAMDFGDLIVKTVELLEKFDSVRNMYRERLQHILVDEFQDTNKAQYRLLRLLLGEHNNICVVGDDDQSIYRWRGAELKNILGFKKDFPGTETIILGENYRSTKTIIQAAAKVIDQNVGRQEKDLFTNNPAGDPISLYRAEDEYEEARFVSRNIKNLNTRKGIDYDQIALFYRTNAQSRVFEEEFARNSIPFQVIGGLRFYERKEIKDVLAYLRAVINPADSISIKRIINVPTRGIGKTTIDKIDEIALERDISFIDAIRQVIEENLISRATNSLKKFMEIIDSLDQEASSVNPQQLVQTALDLSGYKAMLEKDKSIEAMTRRENLDELLRAVGEFEREFPEEDITTYLEQVALVQDQDMLGDASAAVTLMTIHSAKGLEFPAVFIVGLEEGLFPHSRSLNNPDEMEEERRLFYVALTRARKKAFLSSAERRRTYGGRPNFTVPSNFIDDIPVSLLEVESVFSGREFGRQDYSSSFSSRPRRTTTPKPFTPPKPTTPKPETPNEPTIDYSYSQESGDDGDFQIGTLVRHAKLGKGKILFIEGEGEYATVIVQFEKSGIKKLRMQYAKLVKI